MKRATMVVALVALAAAAFPASAASKPASAAATKQTKTKAKAAPPEMPVVVPSPAVTQMAQWVITSGDNNGQPFMIIDKVAAGVWVFDKTGFSMGAAPALVGITPGDDSEPGVGDKELSNIPVEQRTTPAGRFVASFGRASGGRKVLWVDYPTGVSLHAVITRNKSEHRLERLLSPTPDDNRISYGCINVPADFYKETVKTLFSTANGIVYILPETKPLIDVFPAYRPWMPVTQYTPPANR